MKTKALALLLFWTCLSACKQEYFELRSDKTLVVPSTLQDLRALLDNYPVMNTNLPHYGELSGDNYYKTLEVWKALVVAIDRNAYIWADDIYQGEEGIPWLKSYEQVLYANVVLSNLQRVKASEQEKKELRATALFFRAHAFYNLAQVYMKPWHPQTAATDLGIPLPLSPDPLQANPRATVLQTYQRIEEDLLEALPSISTAQPNTILTKYRPGYAAVAGLLARMYLSTQRYELALKYADLCLEKYGELLDFNELNTKLNFPIPDYNREIIFHALMGNARILTRDCLIEDTLYDSYRNDDLRKVVFFTKTGSAPASYRGNFNGAAIPFAGITTSEIWLIKAECLARNNRPEQALQALSALLKTRYKNKAYTAPPLPDTKEVLPYILQERRKELIMRNLRWTDLRRLNQDERFAITIKRTLGEQVYTLPPNDPKYVFPIPDIELFLNPIPQNER